MATVNHDETAAAKDGQGAQRPGRGRRPATEVRAAIVDAAGRLLLEGGIANFTVERVAELSGTSRMTIHKWWASRGALAFDGYRAAVKDRLRFPASDDVRNDVRVQLHAFVRLMTRTRAGRVLSELIGQSQRDAELRAALNEHYTTPRRQLAVDTMRRGQELGQLRRDVDLSALVDQLWGACYNRLLTSDLPITAAFADTLIDNLWRGVEP